MTCLRFSGGALPEQMLKQVKYFASALSFAELSSGVLPQYKGQIWYPETHSLLEPLLTGGRLDLIANEVLAGVNFQLLDPSSRRGDRFPTTLLFLLP